MSDASEKRPLRNMLWCVSIKTRTFASVNTCNGSFESCFKLLKQYRTIEQMCSDAHSITLNSNKKVIEHTSFGFSHAVSHVTFDKCIIQILHVVMVRLH